MCGHNFTTGAPPEMRYTLAFQVADSVGSLWISVFDEVGRQLLNMSASELSEKLNEQSQSFEEVFNPIRMIPYQFRLRAKKTMSAYADQADASRTNYSVISVGPVDYTQRSAVLLEDIARYGYDVNKL